ncbi:hypothetical protein BGZ89_008325 [Linnemannia elongata]|nr:hypothetical protein BGZ89_008325 [Linnemannia elongata]
MSANPQYLKAYLHQSRRLDTITGFGKWVRQPHPLRPGQYQHQEQQPLTPSTAAVITTTAESTITTFTNPRPSQLQLPPELWTQVFSFLYPSQLGPIAAVNKTWKNLVQGLKIWRLISSKAGLLVRSKFFPADYEWIPDHFMLVQEKSQEICEECFGRFELMKVERVLPVGMVSDKFCTRSRNNNNNHGDGDSDSTDNNNSFALAAASVVPDIMIQMCLPCRIDYFTKHPEPMPKHLDPFYYGGTSYKIMPRIDEYTAILTYGLPATYIRSLPFEYAPPSRTSIHPDEDGDLLRSDGTRRLTRMHILQELDVHQLARKVHGGDVGIAYVCTLNISYSHGLWNRSEPKDDGAKRRRVYLRSLLYDRGLAPTLRSVACDAFVESGHGDPKEIAESLDVENWFQSCTNYAHPYKIETRYVKVRLLPDRRQTRLQDLFLDQKVDGGEEGEEDGEWYELSVLNNWLQTRLENGLYQSYKLDPEGPETPPKPIWPLIDMIDMGDTALAYAAECIVEVLMEERRGKDFGVEELEEFGLTVEQISEMIDRKAGRGRGSREVFTLSTLLEGELGDGWETMVVQRVKNLLQPYVS